MPNFQSHASTGTRVASALTGSVARGWLVLDCWMDLMDPLGSRTLEADRVQMSYAHRVSIESSMGPADLSAIGTWLTPESPTSAGA